jgi:hypothetical protein
LFGTLNLCRHRHLGRQRRSAVQVKRPQAEHRELRAQGYSFIDGQPVTQGM